MCGCSWYISDIKGDREHYTLWNARCHEMYEIELLIATDWVLHLFQTKIVTWGSIVRTESFIKRRLCGTLLKALAKSINTSSVWLPVWVSKEQVIGQLKFVYEPEPWGSICSWRVLSSCTFAYDDEKKYAEMHSFDTIKTGTRGAGWVFSPRLHAGSCLRHHHYLKLVLRWHVSLRCFSLAPPDRKSVV